MQKELLQVLKRYWGYDRFRPPQQDIIASVIAGQDTMALLPTGGGKSLCYQLPSLLMPGKTVVISPLLSLMHDQVEALKKIDIDAKSIHSGLAYSQIEAILDSFVYGPLKILYISPERIDTELFQTRFYMANVPLIAVDEAHCISQWGHDFRPSYLKINMLREIKPNVPIIALTATATQAILDDVAEQLGLVGHAVYKKSFARENISFTSIKTEDKSLDFENILRRMKGTGIVYSRSRAGCVKIAKWLLSKGYKATYYHAGMSSKDRESAQNKWMTNKVQIIVATNAFGMGIDKGDVRFVIHMDIPPSLEEYYQEAGRAGRDGQQSFAISIISPQDSSSVLKNYESFHPTIEEITTVYTRLCRYLQIPVGHGEASDYYIDIDDFAKKNEIHANKVLTTLRILEKQEWLSMSEGLKNPSKVVVLCNPRFVNDQYKESDPRYVVLTQLLRSYEGIFNEPAEISEEKIARKLDMNKIDIIAYLQILEAEAMIQYDPSADLPKLIFLKSRPRDESFRIDEKIYQAQKENTWNKLNAVIKYHNSETCRQTYILNYFGEENEISCGKCDVCLGSKDTQYSVEEMGEIMNKIDKSNNGIDPKSLVLQFPYNKRRRLYQCLTDLEQEQKIRIDHEGKIRRVHG